MSISKVSNEQIRKRKGRFDRAKILAATEADIERWKREDGIDDADLGPVRVVVPGPDVRALRERTGLSQDEFADRFGLSLRTLQEWEQRRRVPDGPARLLLRIIEEAPKVVERLVRDDTKSAP